MDCCHFGFASLDCKYGKTLQYPTQLEEPSFLATVDEYFTVFAINIIVIQSLYLDSKEIKYSSRIK